MLHLMRTVDRVLGYVFVQTSESNGENVQKGTLQSNQDALFSSAMGAIPDHNIQNIQERYVYLIWPTQMLNNINRWIDNREEYDAWESREWRQEGMDAIERKSQK